VQNLASIPRAVADLRRGRPVIVVDDEARENEGDIVISAALATREWIAWLVRNSSGFICAPMTNQIADALELPLMVAENQDPLGTAYTVSVDAADRMSTGISATDRAHTLNVLADRRSTPSSLTRPGHILPLRSADAGVIARPGHTEAAVDLMVLADLPGVACISEIVRHDGEMMRLPELLQLGAAEGVMVTSIELLLEYRLRP
jgi:3,4-dihydroxy 2-butanone 4-phosphate synthase / GTP cyclohydrolase II